MSGEYEEYLPYGSTAWWLFDSSRGVSKTRYKYTGMERDEETGLQVHGARHYIVWLGRWMSPDPVGIVHGPYVYCHGDPIRMFDAGGRAPESLDDPGYASARDAFVSFETPSFYHVDIYPGARHLTPTEVASVTSSVDAVSAKLGLPSLGQTFYSSYASWGGTTGRDIYVAEGDQLARFRTGHEYAETGPYMGLSPLPRLAPGFYSTGVIPEVVNGSMSPLKSGLILLHELLHLRQAYKSGAEDPIFSPQEGEAYGLEFALATFLDDGTDADVKSRKDEIAGVVHSSTVEAFDESFSMTFTAASILIAKAKGITDPGELSKLGINAGAVDASKFAGLTKEQAADYLNRLITVDATATQSDAASERWNDPELSALLQEAADHPELVVQP